MKREEIKNSENPYVGKRFNPMYTFYQVALLPILLNQIGMFLLPSEDRYIALIFLVIGVLLFFNSDEFKVLKFDKNFRTNCIWVHAVTYVLAFLIGFGGLYPILVLITLFDLYWAYAIFKGYKKIYELTRSENGVESMGRRP
jgi:phosphatidylserine synthase